MSGKKKQKSSKKTKAFMLSIIVILMFSYGAYFFISNKNYVPPPSASSFRQADWMSLVPSQIEGFRYLNITQLSSYPDLFSSEVIITLPEISLNISLSDVTYGLDMLIDDYTIVSVIALNPRAQEEVSVTLNGSSLDKTSYKDVTLYLLPTSPVTQQGPAWICFYRGAIILSEGEEPHGMKLLIDSNLSPFFTNDTIKVGYLLTSLGEDQLSFSFYRSGNNTYNVDWEMRSVKSGITVRYSLHFPSTTDLDSKYLDVVKNIFSKSKSVYKSDHFIFGDFSYSSSDIRAVLMGL
ncbi:MAG: hypothetical protein ACUVQ5_06380 [Candidatus Methanomethylicaceae archaeon]